MDMQAPNEVVAYQHCSKERACCIGLGLMNPYPPLLPFLTVPPRRSWRKLGSEDCTSPEPSQHGAAGEGA